ncbi:MAG: hypothetical protein J7M34_02405 [Anaerolineae bacterium]|nr:hypothetical protein [Anaerolineae bacterium]
MRSSRLKWRVWTLLIIGSVLLTIFVPVATADDGGMQGITSSTGIIQATPPITSSIAVDPFENDDTIANAKAIVVNGEAQFHLFGVAGDVDWVRFHAQAGQWYLIATEGLQGSTNTVLALYTADEVPVLLAENEGFAGSQAARLIWQAPEDGNYLIRVTEKNDCYGIDAGYWLSVRSGAKITQGSVAKAPVPAPPRMRKW